MRSAPISSGGRAYDPEKNSLPATVKEQWEAWQAAPEGYIDSPELFAPDPLTGGKGLNDPAPVDTLVKNGAAAIKLHNSVNGLIRRNVFRNTVRADHLWLDCGNENNRITGNLFLDGIEQREAIFIECTRDGVNLIDNNIIWNVPGRFDPEKVPKEPGSSGWYKLREDDTVNGYGIYGEGTDRLYIAHNLIGRCRHSGYYAKPVGFRMHGMERGRDYSNGGQHDVGHFNIALALADYIS